MAFGKNCASALPSSCAAYLLSNQVAVAQSVSRAEALRIAVVLHPTSLAGFRENLYHGKDNRGVEVHTPDRNGGRGTPLIECWQVDAENIGVASTSGR